jgi:hypothetical protein
MKMLDAAKKGCNGGHDGGAWCCGVALTALAGTVSSRLVPRSLNRKVGRAIFISSAQALWHIAIVHGPRTVEPLSVPHERDYNASDALDTLSLRRDAASKRAGGK